MNDLLPLLVRWLHFLFGITWIGLLYYLNLVNVRMMASLDAGVRPAVIGANLRRVMAWFRHSSWLTVVAGLVLIYILYWSNGDVGATNRGKTILTGGVLGILMMLNVWGVIWQVQKKIIAAAAAGTPADPSWGRIGLYASRTNFILSFPMLLFMGGGSHGAMDWPMIVVSGLIAAAVGAVVLFTVQKWAAPSF